MLENFRNLISVDVTVINLLPLKLQIHSSLPALRWWDSHWKHFSFAVRTALSFVSRWRWSDTAGEETAWSMCFCFASLPTAEQPEACAWGHPLAFRPRCASRARNACELTAPA
nr:zinc finger protein 684 [Molossus molossus]